METTSFEYYQELEQLREVLRALTADASATTPPKHRASPRTAHGKSRSISVIDSPRDVPLPISSMTRTSITSSFTARNLALPTSPSPLPMHPSQISNTTRKSRRVTIEHDMDRLSGKRMNSSLARLTMIETSKMNKAKALFNIPASCTKETIITKPARTGSEVLAPPKQRRP